MIRIKELNKYYYVGWRPLHALKNLNLKVENGEMISVMGSSGSGKSTLLNILGVLDDYDTGDYFLNDHLMKNLSEKQAAK